MEKTVPKIEQALVQAGSAFGEDRKEAYRRAIAAEKNENAKWVLEALLENAEAAEKTQSPLCDDTGIPHILLDAGPGAGVSGELLAAINEGVARGLRALPGRPMAVLGDDIQRINQSGGLSPDSAAVCPAPFLLRQVERPGLRLHVLLLGGGPSIRAKTGAVYHMHDEKAVIDTLVGWATEATGLLGCTPCTLAVGIGRSHYEATALMLGAMADGSLDAQSDLEKTITTRVNAQKKGPLGLPGETAVLGTFAAVGPQRASGVRIVSMQPCCCFEPRRASVEL